MSVGLARTCARLMAGIGIILLPLHVQAASAPPDFNGDWGRDAHGYPKPYQSKDGSAGYLKPWAADILKRDEVVTKSGHAIANAHTLCYPEGVNLLGGQFQILQGPSEITMLYGEPGQWRTIVLNRPHAAEVAPSWFGESVGHFEGDTLVVDTVGFGVHPQAGAMEMPHTEGLHVVERYRYLKDGETSLAPPPKNIIFQAADVIAGGRNLRMNITVEDPGTYRKPWSVTLDFMPLSARIREFICAENSRDPDLTPLLPVAVIPDF
jgi:hypothetical protein